MARILLDTGLLIRHLRNHQPTVQLIRTFGQTERLAISALTRLEIHAGMHPDERYKTQKLITRFICYNLDETIADHAGDLVYSLQKTGHGISVPDAIIATTALVHQLTLVTYNQAHFAVVPGLRLYPLS
jgi:tRNA(fMet)-specific endonuclease VapC